MCRFPETLLVLAKPRESLYRQALNAEPQTKSRILKPQPCAHNRIAVVPMDTDKQISHQSFVCGPRLSVREVAVPCRGVLQSDRKPGTVSHVGGRCAFRSPKAATAPCSVLSRRGSSWLMTTKFPLCACLMELTAQLQSRGSDLRFRWLPRLQNTCLMKIQS